MDFFVLVALLVLAFPVIAIVALVKSVNTNERLRGLETRFAALELRAFGAPGAAMPRAETPPAAAAPAEAPPEPASPAPPQQTIAAPEPPATPPPSPPPPLPSPVTPAAPAHV